MVKPTVISTFAGCGGSSLGYKMAGFDERLAIEWDNNAVETFKLNFPEVKLFHGDIHKLSVEKCLELSNLNPGQLDIFDGSPPCQGFSTAGKRKLKDDRNVLFEQYARLLTGLQPKVFVMENVTGLIKGHMKRYYLQMMDIFRLAGYNCKGQVINAKYYGVPQSRERVIIIGVKKELGISPSHPQPQTAPINFKQAIQGLNEYCDRELPELLKKYAKHHDNKWSTNMKIYKKIKGNTASGMSTQWANYNKTLGTITKSEISTSGIVHANKQRYLNLSEFKRCASFPDDFQFTDRKKGLERIGNSVPPKLMYYIAKHIKEEILEKI